MSIRSIAFTILALVLAALPAQAALVVLIEDAENDEVLFRIEDGDEESDLDDVEGTVTFSYAAPANKLTLTASSVPVSGSASTPLLIMDVPLLRPA